MNEELKTESKKKKFFESFSEKIKKNKKLQCIIIIGLSLLLVLFFCLNSFGKKNTKSSDTLIDYDSYVTCLENKLSNTLSNVDGAGRVSVVITVESGMETVIAMNRTETIVGDKTEIIETPILVNGKTVVLKELYPKVTGVLIVCDGAKNISVLSKIQQATVSLLNIKADKIEILSMK